MIILTVSVYCFVTLLSTFAFWYFNHGNKRLLSENNGSLYHYSIPQTIWTTPVIISLTSKKPSCGKTKLRFFNNLVKFGILLFLRATEQNPPRRLKKRLIKGCSLGTWIGLFLLKISTLFASCVRVYTCWIARLNAGSKWGLPYTFLALFTLFRKATRFRAKLLICLAFCPYWYAQKVAGRSVAVIATTKSTKFFWKSKSAFVTAFVPSRTKHKFKLQPFTFTSFRTALSTFISFPFACLAITLFCHASIPRTEVVTAMQNVKVNERAREVRWNFILLAVKYFVRKNMILFWWCELMTSSDPKDWWRLMTLMVTREEELKQSWSSYL